jgi:hypothetical protein
MDPERRLFAFLALLAVAAGEHASTALTDPCSCRVGPGKPDALQECIDNAVADTVVVCASSGTYPSSLLALEFGGKHPRKSGVVVTSVLVRPDPDATETIFFPQLKATTCAAAGQKCSAPQPGEFFFNATGLSITNLVVSSGTSSTMHVHLAGLKVGELGVSSTGSSMDVHLSSSQLTMDMIVLGALATNLTDVAVIGGDVTLKGKRTFFKNCNFTQGASLTLSGSPELLPFGKPVTQHCN